MRPTVLTVACAAVCLVAAHSHGQVAAGPEITVQTGPPDGNFGPAVGVAAGGEFVVAWWRAEMLGGPYSVVARALDASGQPRGGEIQVAAGSREVRLTRIAMNAAGAFVVVWQEHTFTPSSVDIMARRYRPDLTPIGPAFRVNSYTPDRQQHPSVAMDAGGRFVIAWASHGGDDPLYSDIHAQRFDAGGNRIGGEFRVNTYTTNYQTGPTLGMADDGRFVVAWNSFGQDGSYGGLFGQRYEASGNPAGSEFQVNSYTTDYQRGELAMARDGAFVVAWTSFGQDGSSQAVIARRYDASGAAQGQEFVVNSYTTGIQRLDGVGTDAAGNFVISWEDSAYDGSGPGIFARRFTVAGLPRGVQFRVNTYTTGVQFVSSVACDAAGNFIVAWMNEVDPGPQLTYVIQAQRFGGLFPHALSVDTVAGSSSDGNRVLEPGETVDVRP